MKSFVLILALGLTRVSSAAADEPLRLTLDDALALLHRQSPEVLAARLRVRAAAGDVVTARLFPNPTLSTGVGNFALGQTNPPGLSPKDTVVAQVGLTEELELWGRRGARIAQANERAAQADAERADLERRLTFDLRSKFVGVMIESERLRLARENLDHYRETVRVSETRARTGEISGAEEDKIALEQRGFEREVDDAAVARREAVADLVPLLGVDVADVDAVGALTLPPAPDDVEQLVRDALDHRPDLKAAARAAEAADAALRLAKATAWPDPTVGVQYAHSEFGVSGDLRDQIGGTLSMPLPVFNRNQGDIQRASAEALIARHDLDKLRLSVPQEVRTAVAHYQRARARVHRYEEAFLRQAREARRAAETSYREGAVSLLELLEAERASVETERDYLDALRDGHTAVFEVTRAAALEGEP